MPDIKPARLDAETLAANFSDMHPPLSGHEARVEADRCYFCYDAPCVTACPTSIDIPLFIRQISTGNSMGSAKTILRANIMGGMCARVCPTETLCEEVCVREVAEGQPVKIGQLQRYATDYLMAAADGHPFERAAATGKRVAVVGAGPAGLSCAHGLALCGHEVTIFEAKAKPGGLNEFGIAAYKATDDFASREVDFILGVGGIDIRYGQRLGVEIVLAELAEGFDAVFLGVGLPDVNALGIEGEEYASDAVDYIARLRQADELSQIEVGRDVVVIGGGMTAIDIATQVKLLGAENVTICYRRGPEAMSASVYEQEVAKKAGVTIRHWLQPLEILSSVGVVSGVGFEFTRLDEEGQRSRGEKLELRADQVFKAIGQTPADVTGLELTRGRIAVDAQHRTSHPKVWAGGDCVADGEDLTVVAVEDGKRAAASIHAALTG